MIWLYLAFIVVVVAVFGYTTRRHGKQPRKLPPKPWGYPVLGNVSLFTGQDRHQKLSAMGKKHGGVFTTKIGIQETIWITSYKTFRAAVSENQWGFAGRPPEMALRLCQTHSEIPGIVAAGIDQESREIRKFALVALRSLGFGKTGMEMTIQSETDQLMQKILSLNGRAFDIRPLLALASANIIASITMGMRFEDGDPQFQVLNHALTEGIKATLDAQRDFAFPFLKFLPMRARENFFQSFGVGMDFLRHVVESHRQQHMLGQSDDFIHVWLESEHGRSTALNRLPIVLLDLFAAGYETTTTTIEWIFLVLLHHPEIQARIHEELDAVVGQGESVTLCHRDRLPLTEAVILETLRMFPVVPFGVPHMTTQEVALGEYILPTDTRVIFHIWSVHHDADLWAEPSAFKPDRFIVDGLLCVPEFFIPFSAGRRACLGEQLARKELFIIFANLMQRFAFKNDPDASLPSLEVQHGIVIYPQPFKVAAYPRAPNPCFQ